MTQTVHRLIHIVPKKVVTSRNNTFWRPSGFLLGRRPSRLREFTVHGPRWPIFFSTNMVRSIKMGPRRKSLPDCHRVAVAGLLLGCSPLQQLREFNVHGFRRPFPPANMVWSVQMGPPWKNLPKLPGRPPAGAGSLVTFIHYSCFKVSTLKFEERLMRDQT